MLHISLLKITLDATGCIALVWGFQVSTFCKIRKNYIYLNIKLSQNKYNISHEVRKNKILERIFQAKK